MSKTSFCVHCGAELQPDTQFCPKCGMSVTGVQQQQQTVQQSPMSRKVGGVPAWIIVGVFIVIILVVPVIPKHKTIYVSGTTQEVTQSTSFATAFQTYTTATQSQIPVYKGSITFVSDTYYNYYQQYYYNCYYDQYGNYYCNYTYWPYYNQYTGSATVDPSDQVVKVETTNEASGLITITLTHLDGTQDTYRHVVSEDLTRGAVTTVTGTITLTNTVTNSVVSPVTNTVPCQNCVAQDTVEYVSILGLLLGY